MTRPTSVQPACLPLEYREHLVVQGAHLTGKVRELLYESNVRRLIIKHEGQPVIEIPVTLEIIEEFLSPTLAAVGAIGKMVSSCTLEIIRAETEIGAAQPQD